jgi:hypothetical protein
MNIRLTPVQKSTLRNSLRFDGAGGRFVYSDRDDRTMKALERVGYASWYMPSGRYGKSHWYITDVAFERAKELFPADAEALAKFHTHRRCLTPSPRRSHNRVVAFRDRSRTMTYSDDLLTRLSHATLYAIFQDANAAAHREPDSVQFNSLCALRDAAKRAMQKQAAS